MPFVPLQSNAAAVAVTSFLDVAAALEDRLHDAEARAEALQRDVQQLQRRQDHAKKWIVTIRRSHRCKSHSFTARVINHALASFESGQPLALSLF